MTNQNLPCMMLKVNLNHLKRGATCVNIDPYSLTGVEDGH